MWLVYQNAQRVIVWLGASNFQIDCLFDWMTGLDKQMLAIARPHTYSTWEAQWSLLGWHQPEKFPPDGSEEALSDLLRREWFSRIWVLQEAALAKSAIIACGWKEVNSRTFVLMRSLLDIDCDQGTQARLDILPGLLRENSWWSEDSSKDLLKLLQKFGRSKATDPRDIIYALIGLSGDAHSSELLRPNYEIGLKDAIQQSIAYFMTQTHDLPKQTPIGELPEWSISELLDALHDLTGCVFKWATDGAHDILLYYLFVSQREKQDVQRVHEYLGYAGYYGPPITIATKKANVSLIKLLLQFPGSKDVVKKDSDGNGPLSIALGQGNLVIANLILKHRLPDTHRRDRSRSKPLLVTSKQEALEASLREYPKYANFATYLGHDTPLLTAIKQGDSSAVEMILNRSHECIYDADQNGDQPMNIAARSGNEKIVDLLLESAASLGQQYKEIRGSDGFTPFGSALVGGSSGIIKRFLCFHLDEVHHAVCANQFDVLRKILDVEPRLADWQTSSATPLGTAARAGDMSIMSLLLDRGAKINQRDHDERTATPLWIAASHGQLDAVRLLVERGADIESMANDIPIKTTPLWAAASRGYITVAMYLLEAGAKVKVAADNPFWAPLKDIPGNTVVFWAATCGGQTEAVRLLVKEGVNLEILGPHPPDQAIESKGASEDAWAKPIWVAASFGYTDIVSLLIKHGADIEARDSYYGMTPLWRAAQQNKPEVMRVLIDGGADIRAKPAR